MIELNQILIKGNSVKTKHYNPLLLLYIVVVRYLAMELTAEQINEHIEKFTPIYKDGKEINPIPKDRKVTVWCEGTNEEGFACNVTANEMGLEALIAKSWIYEDELQTLCGG